MIIDVKESNLLDHVSIIPSLSCIIRHWVVLNLCVINACQKKHKYIDVMKQTWHWTGIPEIVGWYPAEGSGTKFLDSKLQEVICFRTATPLLDCHWKSQAGSWMIFGVTKYDWTTWSGSHVTWLHSLVDWCVWERERETDRQTDVRRAWSTRFCALMSGLESHPSQSIRSTLSQRSRVPALVVGTC